MWVNNNAKKTYWQKTQVRTSFSLSSAKKVHTSRAPFFFRFWAARAPPTAAFRAVLCRPTRGVPHGLLAGVLSVGPIELLGLASGNDSSPDDAGVWGRFKKLPSGSMGASLPRNGFEGLSRIG